MTLARYLIAAFAFLAMQSFSAWAADLTSLYPDCPNEVTYEPPPCEHKTGTGLYLLDCTAPARYWFRAKNGMGCAGKVSGIKLGLARINDDKPRTQFKLYYNLYNGNGFQKDNGRFHIDAMLSHGRIYRDIMVVDLDLQRCYYGNGIDVMVPASGQPGRLEFDFTKYAIENLLIRVEPATNVGRDFHC